MTVKSIFFKCRHWFQGLLHTYLLKVRFDLSNFFKKNKNSILQTEKSINIFYIFISIKKVNCIVNNINICMFISTQKKSQGKKMLRDELLFKCQTHNQSIKLFPQKNQKKNNTNLYDNHSKIQFKLLITLSLFSNDIFFTISYFLIC